MAAEAEPEEDQIENWKDIMDTWDLAASGENRHVTESCVLINGKDTGFTDVHDGPAIYIGRENAHYDLEKSLLANPYPVSEYSRKDSLMQYVDALIDAVQKDEGIQNELMQCYGKPLACWCVPKLCHGHVISLYLVYRLHAGMDPQMAGQQIKKRIETRIDELIKRGEANPTDYY